MVTVESSRKCCRLELCFSFYTTDIKTFILLSSLLQDSTAVASEDSNSLFSEVCPCKWHFNKNTPLSLWGFVWHIASLVSLQVMAAAVYGALCSVVASALLRVRPRQQRAGICRSEPSFSGVAGRCWAQSAGVSLPAWTREVVQAWTKACSGRVCGHGTQIYHQCVLNSERVKMLVFWYFHILIYI